MVQTRHLAPFTVNSRVSNGGGPGVVAEAGALPLRQLQRKVRPSPFSSLRIRACGALTPSGSAPQALA